jgi:hypothetical protein
MSIDAFIKKLKPLPKKPEGWYSVQELIEKSGMPRHMIRDRLKKGIDSKELESMECIHEGRKMNCYREKKK